LRRCTRPDTCKGLLPSRVPIGLVRAAGSELRELRTTSAGLWAIALLVAALLILRSLFGSLGGAQEAHADAVPVAAAGPFADALDPRPSLESRLPVEPPVPTRFGFICGERIGDRVRLMGCGGHRADLFGFYSAPPEPMGACVDGGGYSREPRFSVCWLELRDDGGGTVRLGLPGVQLWDLT